MFSRWLLVICGFLMMTGAAPAASETSGCDGRENPELLSYVQADTEYGWQVTSVQTTEFEIACK